MISVIVLAAGEGRRFGGTKQLEIVRGKPLAQHAVDAAAAEVDEIVVVLGHDAERVEAALELPSHARVIVNDRYIEGQSTSLVTGLEALDPSSEAAVVLMADQPGIEAEHVRSLVAAYRDETASVLRIRFRDGPGPALLARSMWPELKTLTGDAGARALLDADPDRVRWVAFDGDAPVDVDVREDLEMA